MKSLVGNCIVAQSGGPTAVINSSAYGVYREAVKNNKYIKNVFAAENGILGIINQNIFDLGKEDPEQIELLRSTPSSALGSCRYKLKDIENDNNDIEKIFDTFRKYDIKYFFYIGGNDSQDTSDVLHKYAEKIGYDIRIIGIPKTIDNDLVETDHCPGFGSAAKHVATSILEIARDANTYSSNIVTIVEIMGRDAGWLTASSVLANRDLGAPNLIYLPETPFSLEKYYEDVKQLVKEKGKVLVAVSEGIKDSTGKYILETAPTLHDSFGHAQLGGVASFLGSFTKANIEKRVKAIEFNVMQRAAAHLLSATDVNEACMVGEKAVQYAIEGHSGYMVALHRESQTPYKCTTKLVELSKVANKKKSIPREWINEEGNYVLNEFVEYMTPLVSQRVEVPEVNGLPIYAKLKKLPVTLDM